jgi:hypothetical protein
MTYSKLILHRKSSFIGLTLIVLLLLARAVAPGIILKNLNQYLGSFSPLYELHIQELHLNFYRMAYHFDDIEGHLKKNASDLDPVKFLSLKRLDISLAWRELLRGKVVTDVQALNADLKVTTASIDALSGKRDQVKKDAKDVKDAVIPFDLESLRINDSTFVFSDVSGLPPEEDFRLTHVEIVANNLTPANPEGLAIFTALGDIQDTAKIKAVGELRPKHTPVEWSVNVELKEFALTKLNPISRRMVPLTFKQGTLSLYSAIQSTDGKLLGYVKPFLKDVVFVGDKGDFKNVGQFFIEIASTLGNWLLKNSKNHSIATKIAFKTGADGKTEVDTAKAIKVAVDNGFGKALPQKIDETLELK